MIRFTFAVIPAVWVIAIAIIAVQNATPVSVRLLNLQSIEIPFGVLLAFCAAGGMLGAALLLVALGGTPLKRRKKRNTTG
jgi:uncharacterized integral membrane protein